MQNFLFSSFIFIITFCPAVTYANDVLSRVRDTQSISLAYLENPPFSFTDENKQVVGYSIDICLKLADAVKRELKLPKLKVKYVPVNPATRFSYLIDGKADLECGATTNNAERRSRVAFTIPHFFSSVRMVVKTDAGIKNWTDLKDKTIASTKGTTTIQLIKDRNSVRALNIKTVEAADLNESFMMVLQGKADAFPMDDVVLYSLRANSAKPSLLSVVGDPLSFEPYSIMFAKNDPGFKNVIDHEMARMALDGEINKIYDRWFMHPIDSKGTNLNMPMGHFLRDSLKYPSDKVSDVENVKH